MNNQKVNSDNPNEVVVRLVGYGYYKLKTKTVKKIKIKQKDKLILDIYFLEEDLISGNIKGIEIDGKTYFDGESDVDFKISDFSDLNSYLTENDFEHNLLSKTNISIYRKICVNELYCSFDATINLNNFNETLHHVGNFKIIEDTPTKTKIKELLKKIKKEKKEKIDDSTMSTSTDTGYSFKFKNLETGTEWKRLLKTMNSDHLSPLAHTLYLTCLLFHNDGTNKISRESIDYYASNFTEQEREDGLNELIAHGYFKDAKIRNLARTKNASRKKTEIPERNCHYTYDSNILHDEPRPSSMAIGCYIACIESTELYNKGFVTKESFRKYFGWSSSQIDECFKELEKLGYIKTIKVQNVITKEMLTIYLFRKSLDQEFLDVEKENQYYKIVKK